MIVFTRSQKGSLEEFQVLRTYLMPANHAEQLTIKQLHDLFDSLMGME